ncbi:MAG: hypothetical protein C0594_12675 [Marinilabiliales bacterium]|nr:MAG: hypothetical protein C0594_12675 [Marinilabiliales bacterium]
MLRKVDSNKYRIMPIEIKELLIKTKIEDSSPPKKETGKSSQINKAELIEECVNAVIDRLQEMKER